MLNLVQTYILNGPQLLLYQIYTSRVIPAGRREYTRTASTACTLSCRTGLGHCDVLIREAGKSIWIYSDRK